MKIENSTKIIFKYALRYALCAMLWMSPLPAFCASLDGAYKDYINGDYEEALTKAVNVRQNDESLYFLGLAYIKMENYPQAREYLLKLTRNFPRSPYHEQGLIKLGDTYMLEGNTKQAQALYEDIEKKQSNFDGMPLVYLRLSQIAAKEGRWDDNKKYTTLLKERYPGSIEANILGPAQEVCYFFSIQVGAFSKKKNAEELEAELKKNYAAYIAEEKNGGYALYKVRVGKFTDRKEAESMRVKLAKQGYPARIYP
ncbi:MAG: SPOR domain-containing protein [Candidatus Omnitrophica bacterium]|nr:SPOR domain-containing protein [Candidatus Omnitrophota bacterium]